MGVLMSITSHRGQLNAPISTIGESSSVRAPGWLRRPQLTRLDRVVLAAILGYAALLVGLATRLSPEHFSYAFSEVGPFEEISIVLWLGASLAVLTCARPLTSRSVVFALLFAAFAAREASWHKAFTTDSLLKISYYLKSPAPLTEKILAGIVAALFIAMLIYTAIVVIHFLFAEAGLVSRAGYWLVLAGVLFVLVKIVDRTPSLMHDFTGHHVQVDIWRLMKAFEEGFEMLTPALFALSAWVSRTDKPFLS
jgi:hypothetical protein